MGMTMTQKILAAHAGLESVTAGQLIEAKLDIVMANDITGPMALPILKQMADQVFDKEKVVFVPDHFTPNKDIKSAENSKYHFNPCSFANSRIAFEFAADLMSVFGEMCIRDSLVSF